MNADERRFIEHDWTEPDSFLMADEALIEAAEGALWRLCALEKAPEPVLRPTEPWEDGDGTSQRPVQQDPIDGSVLFDTHQNRYILWYRTHNRELYDISDPWLRRAHHSPLQASKVCIATSEDGLHWKSQIWVKWSTAARSTTTYFASRCRRCKAITSAE